MTEAARKTCLEVLQDDPDNARALHVLGVIEFDAGRKKQGIDLIERSIRIEPSAHAYNDLGHMWGDAKVYDLASNCFAKALELDPNNPFAHNNQARLYELLGEPEESLLAYARAVEMAPDVEAFRLNLAEALLGDKQHSRVIDMLTDGPGDYQDAGRALYIRGQALEQTGHFSSAAQDYRKAFSNHGHTAALANLIALPNRASTAEVQSGTQLLAQGDLSHSDVIALGHALGKHSDRSGKYKNAFNFHTQANTAQLKSVGPVQFSHIDRAFENMRIIFSADNIKKWSQRVHVTPSPGRRAHTFIVGLPRTGTSLTEQIIASHPSGFGGGELLAIPKGVRAYFPNLDAPSRQWLRTLDERSHGSALNRLQRDYKQEAGRLAPSNADIVTDKFPPNFMHVGLIASAFPKAKFVHCIRTPSEVGLSCYMQAFRMENDYTNRLEDFSAYYRLYAKLMRHWQDALGERMLSVRYEDMVTDEEKQIRRLIAFLDLPWSDRCLSFHKTERVVRTPSNWQVRQKIYSSSLSRTLHYESYLGALKELDAIAL